MQPWSYALFDAVALMAAVVFLDVTVPRGWWRRVRFDRDAFYFAWPVGEMVTRNGIFCREIHVIVFGYEYRWAALDTLWASDFGKCRVSTRGWRI